MTGIDRKSYFWLVSSSDEYELPLFVTDNTKEAAAYMGITVGSLFSEIGRNGGQQLRTRKYILTRCPV